MSHKPQRRTPRSRRSIILCWAIVVAHRSAADGSLPHVPATGRLHTYADVQRFVHALYAHPPRQKEKP